MSDDNDRWPTVGEAITERMGELGYSQADLVRQSGVGEVTVRKLERGEPGNYRKPNLRKISLGLKWPPDAIERILAGETPSPNWETRSLTQVILEVGQELGINANDAALSSADAIDFEELRRLDPEGFESLMNVAHRMAEQARERQRRG